jgi:predicted dehydrogenase
MSPPVRLGVVGAGTIALRGILPHLAQLDVHDRVRVTVVCDPVPGRAERAAELFGIPRASLSYDELLADGEVDAVSIASPIGLHSEQGRQALLAGKHVHFNKTMSIRVEEASELIELARERDLRIVASPGEMLRPHNQEIRRLIAGGAIGTPCWAICGAAFGRYHEEEPERAGTDGVPPIDPSWYFRRPGGGPLYDMTVYALHGLTGILGPARRVTALSGVRIRERQFAGQLVPTDADDNTIMLLDFGDHLFAVVYGTAAGGVASNPGFSGTYFGTEGTIAGLTLNGEPLEYPGRDLARQAPAGDLDPGGGGNEWLLPHIHGEHRQIPEQHVFEDIMQLVDWINDGTPSIVTAEHARHVIEIIEGAYRSSESGRVQELHTTFAPTMSGATVAPPS